MRSLDSFEVKLAAITALLTSQARPNEIFDGTYTYGVFLSSHKSGRWRRIARSGAVSAARIIILEVFELASLDPEMMGVARQDS